MWDTKEKQEQALKKAQQKNCDLCKREKKLLVIDQSKYAVCESCLELIYKEREQRKKVRIKKVREKLLKIDDIIKVLKKRLSKKVKKRKHKNKR